VFGPSFLCHWQRLTTVNNRPVTANNRPAFSSLPLFTFTLVFFYSPAAAWASRRSQTLSLPLCSPQLLSSHPHTHTLSLTHFTHHTTHCTLCTFASKFPLCITFPQSFPHLNKHCSTPRCLSTLALLKRNLLLFPFLALVSSNRILVSLAPTMRTSLYFG
jgi:hypothetical protein